MVIKDVKHAPHSVVLVQKVLHHNIYVQLAKIIINQIILTLYVYLIVIHVKLDKLPSLIKKITNMVIVQNVLKNVLNVLIHIQINPTNVPNVNLFTKLILMVIVKLLPVYLLINTTVMMNTVNQVYISVLQVYKNVIMILLLKKSSQYNVRMDLL